MIELGSGVEVQTSNGGSVTMYGTAEDLTHIGFEDGYAFWNDVYVDPSVPMFANISDHYNVSATLKHVTGDPIVHFSIISQQPNGTADFRFTGLQPDAWYRLQFNGVLASTAGGKAHGNSGSDGIIEFPGVEVPTE
jgi:hypothetical protein